MAVAMRWKYMPEQFRVVGWNEQSYHEGREDLWRHTGKFKVDTTGTWAYKEMVTRT